RELRVRTQPVRLELELRRRPSARPLRRQLPLEPFEVDVIPLLFRDLARQLEWIAVRVVQPKHVPARKLLEPARRRAREDRDEVHAPALERLPELRLLRRE